mgnify:CR=1 FL=1
MFYEDKVLNENDYVGTGMVIKLIIQGVEYDSLNICIKGDLDGDGMITSLDSEIMNSLLLETEIYDDLVYFAADIIEDGVIAMPDDRKIKSYLNGEILDFK